MSINLSYLQLMEPDFIDYMQETLAATQVDPGRIIVEMTESVIASRAHALGTFVPADSRIWECGSRWMILEPDIPVWTC